MVFKNSIWLLLANITQLVSGIVMVSVIGKALGPAFLGEYTFAYAFGTIFSIFINLGFPTLIVRDVSSNINLHSKYFSNILLAKIILAVVGVLVVFSCAYLLSARVSPFVFILVNITIITASFSSFLYMFFRARQNMMPEGVIESIGNILCAVFYLIFFFSGGITIVTVVLIICIRDLLKLCLSIFLFVKKGYFIFRRSIISYRDSWRTVVASLRFAENDLMNMANSQVDVILLGVLQSSAAVGYYSVPIKLIAPLRMIVFSVSQGVLPKLSMLWASNVNEAARLFNKVFKSILFFTLFASFFLFLVSGPIVLLLFGKEFAVSVKLLQMYSIFCVFLVIAPFLSTCLYAFRQESIVFRIRIISLILSVFLNWFLIGKFSYFGAMWAMILTSFGVMIYQKHYCNVSLKGRI